MFEYLITQKLGVLSTLKNGVTLELNKVSFNGEAAKWDLRRWGTNGSGERRMHKGVTLTYNEIKALKEALNAIEDL